MTETRTDVRQIVAQNIRCHDMDAGDQGYMADDIMDALEAAGLVVVAAQRIRVLEAFVVAFDEHIAFPFGEQRNTDGLSWDDCHSGMLAARAAVGELGE